MDGSQPEIPDIEGPTPKILEPKDLSDFEGPTPSHINEAIRREDAEAGKTGIQVEKLRSLKGNPVTRNRLLTPVIEQKQLYQRRAEQIRSEFGIPGKHKLARAQLANEE